MWAIRWSASFHIQASDIHKTYHTGTVNVLALRGIDLHVGRGEMVAIMGPSGCGKTTLLNCLSGLDAADSGLIEIEGARLTDMSDRERTDYRARRMGFVFQFYNRLPVLNAVENVELPLLVSGVKPKEARDRALAALEQVGLGHRAFHRPAELSGGERQRTTIARSLVNVPAIVWADEPTGDLDSETARDIMDVLVKLNGEQGLTFVLVLAVLALAAWRSRVMFKLGLRPIPRRRAQSALIVLGLMLATLIITAAFVTGDTLSHTIRSLVVEGLGEIDERIRLGGRQSFGARSLLPTYFPFARFEELRQQLAGYDRIDMFIPAISENIPVVNTTRSRSERSVELTALRSEDAAVLYRAELANAQGRSLPLAELGPHEVYLSDDAAAAPGDQLDLYAAERPTVFVVRDVAVGGEDSTARLFLPIRPAQVLFNQRGNINVIFVSHVGDALEGAQLSGEVTSHLRGLLTEPSVMRRIFDMLSRDPSVAAAIRRTALVRQAAIAIENARLFENVQPRVYELEIVKRVSTAQRAAETLDE